MFSHGPHILSGNASSSSGNITLRHSPNINWGALPVINMTFLFVNILLNSFVLCHFLRYKHLRTPFAMYLMNLLFTNLAMTFLQTPIKIVANLYSSWTILNPATCTLNLYGGGVIGGGMMTSHMLITANRIWAITWPISYKVRHTKRVALLAVVSMWCYIHILKLPQLILDGHFYRFALSEGCVLNRDQLRGLIRAVNLLIYDASYVFILGAYPFIWWKFRHMTKVGDYPHFSSATINGMNGIATARTDMREASGMPLPGVYATIVIAVRRRFVWADSKRGQGGSLTFHMTFLIRNLRSCGKVACRK